ncbi:MAG TPA: hypothetical protein VGE21_00985 [Flavobacteriales bacterium]
MKMLAFLLLFAATFLMSCYTGVDKNPSDPEPAVGRTDGDQSSDTAQRDHSNPIRNLNSDTTGTSTGDQR